tara:strand:- start:30491 stop:32050 length:1560 start_codon:yes stop_codon:yes gene_type:complete
MQIRKPELSRHLLAAAVLTLVAASLPAQEQFLPLPRLLQPALPGVAHAFAMGDVDGDGDLDIVAGNSDQFSGRQNYLLLNTGYGVFVQAPPGRLPIALARTSALVLADLDGDGDLDLFETAVTSSAVLLRNDGAGAFTDVSATALPAITTNANALAVADLDGDGDLDVVLSGLGGEVLLLNNGNGTFSDATAGNMPNIVDNTISIAIGDVDGDGDLDVLTGNLLDSGPANPMSGQTRLYLNNGSATFTDATQQLPVDSLTSTTGIALGDIDADGDLDAVLSRHGECGSNQCGKPNKLFRNNGSGVFVDAGNLGSDWTKSVALADVDGDGDLDAVFGNATPFSPLPTNSQNQLWLNTGGSFADATQRLPSEFSDTEAIAMGDVDGDGDLDIVFGSPGQNRQLTNVQRQMHAASPPRIGLNYSIDVYMRYTPPSSIQLAALCVASSLMPSTVTPFGMLGIDPLLAAPLPTMTIAQPTGQATLTVTLPNAPGLVGAGVYVQAMLVGYPNDLRLSNVLVDVVQ